MKTITITFTDGETITEGPYTNRVAKQYSDDWKSKKRSVRYGVKSVRVNEVK